MELTQILYMTFDLRHDHDIEAGFLKPLLCTYTCSLNEADICVREIRIGPGEKEDMR